jgi:hypothetical protein
MARYLTLIFIAALTLQSTVLANSLPQGTKLYAVQLESINIPLHFQERIKDDFFGFSATSYIYLNIFINGNLVWTSPRQEIKENQTAFSWPADETSVAGLFWGDSDHTRLQVLLADDELQNNLIAGAKGAADGAGLGALIGMVIAGVATMGPGAPAGAFIGAAIGGGTLGTSAMLEASFTNNQVLIEYQFSEGTNFPLNGSIPYTVTSPDQSHTAEVNFRLLESKPPLSQGGLELNEKYIVRVHSIHLSEIAALKGGKNTDRAQYYVVLQQGPNRYPFFKDDPFNLTPGLQAQVPLTTVLRNSGFSTAVHLYKKNNFFPDKLILSSTIAELDGRSWAFIGKATSDDVRENSHIVFETFGPLRTEE